MPETEKGVATAPRPTVSENGSGGILTKEQVLERAPRDLVEQVLEIPEWGGKVKLRSLSAFASARVKQRALIAGKDNQEMRWPEIEVEQFMAGVVEPKFTETEVRGLQVTSGAGFRRIIAWLDEHSGTDKEEEKAAAEEFPGAND